MKQYRVLANDGLGQEGVDVFNRSDFLLDIVKHNTNDLLDVILEYDALLVRSATKVTKEVIEAGVTNGGKLKIVGRAGVGYDNVDDVAARENGVVVKFAPNGNTNATAELALGLMFSSARNIPQAYGSLKAGFWEKKKFVGVEISNKTLGIIGCGRIGQRLSELVSGFGMDLLGYDVNPDYCMSNFPDSKIRYVDKLELLERSDFVSLHTGGKDVIIGSNELEIMKKDAILVNASRGSNIDENALYVALSNRSIRAAGLDSYIGEPKQEGDKITESMARLSTLDNVVFSSHLGASTKEADSKTSREIAEVVVSYFRNASYKNSVNTTRPKDEEKESYSLFVTHKDVPNMFAKISNVLGEYGINIRDNPSQIFPGTDLANTVYLLHNPVDENIIGLIREVDGVIRVTE